MQNQTRWIRSFISILGVFILLGCSQKQKPVPEISQEELTAAVPQLSDLHTAVYPLWHDAYPNKDYDQIKQLLPQLDSLTARVESAELPGILRDKQEAWEIGKENLKASLTKLQEAAATNNSDEMLKGAEEFHANYEKLVRTIRPMVKELDAFHQEMYKLYHYYLPNYDLAKIRATVTAMQEKLPPLLSVELPARLQDRKEKWDAAVADLNESVNKLAEIVKKDEHKAIAAAVEEVHTAYQGCEEIFN